jgi:hypothetical protein
MKIWAPVLTLIVMVGAAETIPLYLRGTAADDPDFRDSVLVEVIFVPVDSVAHTVTGELVLADGI